MNSGSQPLNSLPLGADAIAYVTGRLVAGLTLGRLVAARDWSRSTAYTWLPDFHDPADAIDFSSGGILSHPSAGFGAVAPIPNADARLAEHLTLHLRNESSRVCVLENALAGRDDPNTRMLPDVVTYEREVYHVLGTPTPSVDHVLRVVRAAKTSLEMVVVLSRRPSPAVALDTFGMADLEQLAEHADGVIVGAYDGESYVVAQLTD